MGSIIILLLFLQAKNGSKNKALKAAGISLKLIESIETLAAFQLFQQFQPYPTASNAYEVDALVLPILFLSYHITYTHGLL